jgi:hypothetical protein
MAPNIQIDNFASKQTKGFNCQPLAAYLLASDRARREAVVEVTRMLTFHPGFKQIGLGFGIKPIRVNFNFYLHTYQITAIFESTVETHTG